MYLNISFSIIKYFNLSAFQPLFNLSAFQTFVRLSIQIIYISQSLNISVFLSKESKLSWDEKSLLCAAHRSQQQQEQPLRRGVLSDGKKYRVLKNKQISLLNIDARHTCQVELVNIFARLFLVIHRGYV